MKNLKKYRVESPEEMIALGVRYATELSAGAIIALKGGLGAGKTHFTKGFVKGLESGVDCTGADVTSPTFSLAHEYTEGKLPVYHFDFYRMESEEEVLGIGWDEYLDLVDLAKDGGVIIVEWPDKFPHLLPKNTLWLNIEHDGDARIISEI